MDAYLFPRDPYRSSAPPAYSSYPSSYHFQPQYSHIREPDPYGLLPPYPSYALVPSDRRGFLARGADRPASFYPETLPPRGYARPARGFRERGDGKRPKKASVVQQNLGPRKNTFKTKPGAKAVKQAVKTVEKVVQGGKKVNKEGGKKTAKEVSKEVKATDRLAEETKELHALWRTAGQKRKLEDERKVEETAKVSKVAEKVTEEGEKGDSKKSRRRKKQKKAKKGPAEKKSSEFVSEAEPTDKGKGLLSVGKPENEKVIKVPLTEEEKTASLDLQRKLYKSVSEFLGGSQGSEKTDKEVLPDSEVDGGPKPKEEETSEESQEREEKAYDFFSKILEENQELRKLYVEKCSGGMFECMVCSSIDETSSKKFFNLVSLVMHASKIQKTEKRPEHRGYGRALCSVLGWDPLRTKRLPKNASDAVADRSIKKEDDSVEAKNLGDVVQVKVENGGDTDVQANEGEGIEPSESAEAKDVNVELTVQVSTEEASAA